MSSCRGRRFWSDLSVLAGSLSCKLNGSAVASLSSGISCTSGETTSLEEHALLGTSQTYLGRCEGDSAPPELVYTFGFECQPCFACRLHFQTSNLTIQKQSWHESAIIGVRKLRLKKAAVLISKRMPQRKQVFSKTLSRVMTLIRDLPNGKWLPLHAAGP